VIDDELLVKTRTNTCLSYTSAVPSYSVTEALQTAESLSQCFYNCLFKNPFYNLQNPFFPTAGKFVVHAPD
jgi:hypothetical protein